MIVVELYGSNGPYMEMKDLILDTKLYIPGKETEEFVTIKPKKMEKLQNETD